MSLQHWGFLVLLSLRPFKIFFSKAIVFSMNVLSEVHPEPSDQHSSGFSNIGWVAMRTVDPRERCLEAGRSLRRLLQSPGERR